MPFSALVSFPRAARAIPALLGAALSLNLALAVPSSAAPSWNVPEKVSQGHAFVVTGRDSAPFSAEVQWRGKTIPVKARPMKEAGRWEAAVMLGVPLDEVKKQPLTLRATDSEGETSSRTLTVTPLRVKWIEQQLSVEPKFVTPPPKARKQIEKDRAHTGAVLSAISPVPSWKLPFSARSGAR